MSKKRNVRKNSRVSKKGGTKNTLRTTKPLTLSKGGVNSNNNKPITTMNNLKNTSTPPPINFSSLSPGGTTPSEPLNKVTPPITPPVEPTQPIEVKPPVDTGVALPKEEPNSDPEPESKEEPEPEKREEEEKQLEDAILNQNDEDKAQAKIEVEKANELETQLEKLEKGLVKLTTLLQTDETQNDTENPNKKKFIQALISITEISIDDLKNKRTINHWENTKNELKK